MKGFGDIMDKYIRLCKYINHNWYGDKKSTAVERIADVYSRDTLRILFNHSPYIDLFFIHDESMRIARKNLSKFGNGNSYRYQILPLMMRHSESNRIDHSLSIGFSWSSLDINTDSSSELRIAYNIDLYYNDSDNPFQLFKVNKEPPYHIYIYDCREYS